MQFAANEDINAPMDQVFAVISEFEGIEKMAIRRGIEVTRAQPDAGTIQGTRWTAKFDFRGKPRVAKIVLRDISAPDGLAFDTVTGGLGSKVQIDLVALTPTLTRMTVTADLEPGTLAARLFVQSLRLAKGKIDKRFKTRLSDTARLIEARAAEAAA